jgi:hypothetical protein
MMTLDVLRLEIKNKRFTSQMTWQEIAKDYGINRAMARLIALGYQPGKKMRNVLKLSPSATVVVFGEGQVPDGSQTIRALRCACGQWFIPNHPARKHCFLCHPSRSNARKKGQ